MSEDTKTPLHESLSSAVEDAVADPHKTEPRRGQAGEILDTPDPVPHGGVTSSTGDEADNSSDSGNDVDISVPPATHDTHSDVNDIYDTRKGTFRVGVPTPVPSPFAQYASHSAPEAAQAVVDAVMGRKQFGVGGNAVSNDSMGVRLTTLAPEFNATTDARDAGAGAVVSGASATLDGNALRIVEQQMHDVRHAGGDTKPLEVQRDALRAPFIGIKAPLPVFRRPEVAAGLEAK